jgi:hypothetical protein
MMPDDGKCASLYWRTQWIVVSSIKENGVTAINVSGFLSATGKRRM